VQKPERRCSAGLRRISVQDVKDFLLAYCACFVAALAFII